MAVKFILMNHRAVIRTDSLQEIRDFWKKLCEDFLNNRLKFSNYSEKSDGKHIATYQTDNGQVGR